MYYKGICYYEYYTSGNICDKQGCENSDDSQNNIKSYLNLTLKFCWLLSLFPEGFLLWCWKQIYEAIKLRKRQHTF